MKKIILLIFSFLIIIIAIVNFSSCNRMKLKIYNFIYKDNGKKFEGYFAVPKKLNNKQLGKTPAILLIHEWVGLGDYIKMRAREFAKLGYVVFAMDMYGKGIRAKNHKDAGKLMQIYMDNRSLMVERTKKALRILKEQPHVDQNKIAVVGYCFGGAVVLELALKGEKISGGVTFHGVLVNSTIEQRAKNIQTELLFHHGALDPMLSLGESQKLQDTLDKANVHYSFISYSNALHGFTRMTANDENHPSLKYNKQADEKSWLETEQFLKRVFR